MGGSPVSGSSILPYGATARYGSKPGGRLGGICRGSGSRGSASASAGPETSSARVAVLITRSVRSDGCSLDTTYMVPLFGSTADNPQFAPPLLPGIWMVPCRLGG